MDCSVVLSARLTGYAKNSIKSYKSGFNLWKQFALKNGLELFPVNKIELSICLINKVENGGSWSTVNQCINGVKFFHRLFLKTTDKHCVDEQILQFLIKNSRKPDNKRRPLLKDEFEKIISVNLNEKSDIVLMRNLCVLIFSWIGFLRYDDVSQLKWNNVNIEKNVIRLKLYDAKNDKKKKGQSVRFQLNCNLMNIVNNYLEMAGLFDTVCNDSVYLFFEIDKGCCLYQKRLSYVSMYGLLISLCEKSGVDTTKIGTHSLRIGGCTEASRSGIPDYVLDYYGRWALNSTSRARYQRVLESDAIKVSDVLN